MSSWGVRMRRWHLRAGFLYGGPASFLFFLPPGVGGHKGSGPGPGPASCSATCFCSCVSARVVNVASVSVSRSCGASLRWCGGAVPRCRGVSRNVRVWDWVGIGWRCFLGRCLMRSVVTRHSVRLYGWRMAPGPGPGPLNHTQRKRVLCNRIAVRRTVVDGARDVGVCSTGPSKIQDGRHGGSGSRSSRGRSRRGRRAARTVGTLDVSMPEP